MNSVKKLFDFYINASIHVALAVFAFVKITEVYFNISANNNLDFFIFFGTITGYNFVKFAGVLKKHHQKTTNYLKAIQIFTGFCFIAMCYFAFFLSTKTLVYAAPFAVLTFLYAVPFLSGFHKNLRQIGFLKVIIVAIVWAGFTVLIPLMDAGKEITFPIILAIIQRFLIVVVLILPFDIRDVQYDAISLQTIPKIVGIQQTKRLGIMALIFSLVLEYLISTSSELKTPFMLFFFITILFLMRSKINQPKYYSSFWVESLPIIWWLLLIGFHNF